MENRYIYPQNVLKKLRNICSKPIAKCRDVLTDGALICSGELYELPTGDLLFLEDIIQTIPGWRVWNIYHTPSRILHIHPSAEQTKVGCSFNGTRYLYLESKIGDLVKNRVKADIVKPEELEPLLIATANI